MPTLIIVCPLTVINLMSSWNIILFNHLPAIVVVIGRSMYRMSSIATVLTTQIQDIHIYTIDLEKFSVKKLHRAHTLTKLKHSRFFYYDNFTFESLVHASSFHTTHSCMPIVHDNNV